MKYFSLLFFFFALQLVSAQKKIELHTYAVYFDSDEASINLSSQNIQDSIVTLLGDDLENYSILIHAQTDPIGNKNYNKRLANKRALSVKDIFLSLGFNNLQITTTSSISIITNSSNEEENARKRRADVTIVRERDAISFQNLPILNLNLEEITGLQLSRQKRKINPCIDNQIQFDSGTKLFVPANSYLDAGCDELEIVLIEMFDPVDFMLSGIPMSVPNANGVEHFNSAGMFQFNAYRSNKEYKLSQEAKISFEFKTSQNPEAFEKFSFNSTTNNWNTLTQLNSDNNSSGTFDKDSQFINSFCDAITVKFPKNRILMAKFLNDASDYIKSSTDQLTLNPPLESGCSSLIRNFEYYLVFEKKKKEPTTSYLHFINEKYKKQDILNQIPFIISGVQINKSQDEMYLESLKFSGKKIKSRGKIYFNAHYAMFNNKRRFSQKRTLAENVNNFREFNYTIPDSISKEELKLANIQLKEALKYNADYKKLKNANSFLKPSGNSSAFMELNLVTSKLNNKSQFGTKKNFHNFIKALEADKQKFISLYSEVANDTLRLDTLLNAFGVIKNSPKIDYNILNNANNIVKGELFGVNIFNADQLIKMPNVQSLSASYKNENGEPINMIIAFYMTANINGLIRYDGNIGTAQNFYYRTDSENSLIVLDEDLNVYIIDKKEFDKGVKENKNKAEFKVKLMKKGTPREEWIAALN